MPLGKLGPSDAVSDRTFLVPLLSKAGVLAVECGAADYVWSSLASKAPSVTCGPGPKPGVADYPPIAQPPVHPTSGPCSGPPHPPESLHLLHLHSDLVLPLDRTWYCPANARNKITYGNIQISLSRSYLSHTSMEKSAPCATGSECFSCEFYDSILLFGYLIKSFFWF